MEPKTFFTSTSLSINVDKNELDLINENYEDVTNDDEKLSFKKYFFKLHSKALSVVKPNVSKKEDLEKIQHLESEIMKINENFQNALNDTEFLEKKIDKKNEEIQSLKNEISMLSDKKSENLLKNENTILKNEIRELSGRKPEKVFEKVIEKENVEIPVRLSDNQTLINLTPIEADIMKVITNNESIRTRRIITPEIIFKDIFNRYVTNGPCDFFPIPSNRVLREIAEKHKNLRVS